MLGRARAKVSSAFNVTPFACMHMEGWEVYSDGVTQTLTEEGLHLRTEAGTSLISLTKTHDVHLLIRDQTVWRKIRFELQFKPLFASSDGWVPTYYIGDNPEPSHSDFTTSVIGLPDAQGWYVTSGAREFAPNDQTRKTGVFVGWRVPEDEVFEFLVFSIGMFSD